MGDRADVAGGGAIALRKRRREKRDGRVVEAHFRSNCSLVKLADFVENNDGGTDRESKNAVVGKNAVDGVIQMVVVVVDVHLVDFGEVGSNGGEGSGSMIAVVVVAAVMWPQNCKGGIALPLHESNVVVDGADAGET